jgi:WD domain, G-beta repeat
MDDSIRHKLEELVARRGPGLCAAPDQCKQALQRICRKHPTEKYILVNIFELGMVNQILAMPDAASWPALQEELAARLVSERALHDAAARWGLNSWALALGMITEDQLEPEAASQMLGKDIEAHSLVQRLLTSLVAGAVVASVYYFIAAAMCWGMQGPWGSVGGAVVGAGFGLIRNFRDGVLTPFVIAGWGIGGFLGATLIEGIAAGTDLPADASLAPLLGAVGWVLAGSLARTLFIIVAQNDAGRSVQAATVGGALGCAVGWPAAYLVTAQAVTNLESPWDWSAALAVTGVLHAFLEISQPMWKGILGRLFVRTLLGAVGGIVIGYVASLGHGDFLGWPIAGALLWAVPGTISIQTERHMKPVWGVAYSPKGDFALSASADGTIGLWQLEDRSLVGFYQGHDEGAYCVAFSHDGNHCVSGSSDATVRVVDGGTGDEEFCLTGHTDTVLGVAFSADDALVVSGSADGTVRIWDLNEEEERRCLQGHSGPVTSVAFSPDGAMIASGSMDGTARLWETVSGQELHKFTGHGAIHALAFTPDGKGLVIAGDEALRLWGVEDEQVKTNFAGHTGPVHGVSISLDGRRLLSAGEDGSVRLWDMATGKEIVNVADHDGPVRSVAFAPNGRSALSGGDDGTVRLLKLPLPG